MATYHIDPANGSNSNSGTSQTDAFADFTPVANGGSFELDTGDTCRVHPTGTINTTSTNGNILYLAGGGSTSGDPIVVESADPDQRVHIDASGLSKAIYFYAVDNIIFRGFDIQYGGTTVSIDVQGGGFQNTFENCLIRDGNGGHLNIGGSGGDHTVRNCISFNQTHENGDGFTVDSTPSNVLFEECRSYHDRDGGFDTYAFTGDDPVTFRNCIVGHAGVTKDGVTTDSTGTGNGTGFKLGADGTNASGGHILENCVAYGCKHGNQPRGFTDNYTSEGSTMYNCTAWDCGTGFHMESPNGAANEVRNCIAYQCDTSAVFNSESTHDHNTWNLNISNPGFRSTALTDDPYKNMPADNDFLRLSSSSPCIDAGTDVGLEYEGSAPDLGAFEYVSGAVLKYWDGTQWMEVVNIQLMN